MTDAAAILSAGVREIGGYMLLIKGSGGNITPNRGVLLPGGKCVMAHIKPAEGRLSAAEEQQIRRIRKLGYQVFVAYGVPGVESLVEYLKHMVEGETKWNNRS